MQIGAQSVGFQQISFQKNCKTKIMFHMTTMKKSEKKLKDDLNTKREHY